VEYIAYLHKEQDSDFGVSFPDFPGCATAGKTLEEARKLAPEALALHVAGMVEDGEVIPEPSSLDDLADDPDMRGAVAFLVSAEAPEKTIRINITARESQIAEIDRLAESEKMTRSAFIIRMALQRASGPASPSKRVKPKSKPGKKLKSQIQRAIAPPRTVREQNLIHGKTLSSKRQRSVVA